MAKQKPATPRKPSPFTPQQVAAIEKGRCSGLELRLIETVRDRERLIDAERLKNQGDRADELADQVARLQAEIERYKQDCDHYRVLICAHHDKSLEVWADPQVKLRVVCLPETNNEQDFAAACEWVLGQVPNEFKGMMDDITLRPELFSIHCLDRIGWRYYHARMEEFAYLDAFGEAVDAIAAQAK